MELAAAFGLLPAGFAPAVAVAVLTRSFFAPRRLAASPARGHWVPKGPAAGEEKRSLVGVDAVSS